MNRQSLDGEGEERGFFSPCVKARSRETPVAAVKAANKLSGKRKRFSFESKEKQKTPFIAVKAAGTS